MEWLIIGAVRLGLYRSASPRFFLGGTAHRPVNFSSSRRESRALLLDRPVFDGHFFLR